MSRRAFTLLEVVVALAILAVSLMAVLDINTNAVYSHVYAKKLTVATLLARGKMIDLEQKLYDEGLNAEDDEDAGDFSDEGWPSFKWRAKVIVPKTNGLSPEQLFGALFNLPLGGGGKDGAGGAAGLLGALFGAGGAGDASKAGLPPGTQPGGQGGAAGLLGALGPMAGVAQAQFTQMVDQLQKSVREVHLTVTWKEGKLTESIDLVTHVVSLGPGSDRNGGAAGVAGVSSAPSSEQWRRPDGTPARSPRPSPTGVGMVDDDGTQLVSAGQQALTNPAVLLPGMGAGLQNMLGPAGRMLTPGAAGILKPQPGGFK
ncbi:MAG: prepilin-type N-terminal cleavage/methylation domain-containing protein [Myxococcota bacterium]